MPFADLVQFLLHPLLRPGLALLPLHVRPGPALLACHSPTWSGSARTPLSDLVRLRCHLVRRPGPALLPRRVQPGSFVHSNVSLAVSLHDRALRCRVPLSTFMTYGYYAVMSLFPWRDLYMPGVTCPHIRVRRKRAGPHHNTLELKNCSRL